VKEGKITVINNDSGHYKPTKDQLFKALGGLFAAGFISESTKVQVLEQELALAPNQRPVTVIKFETVLRELIIDNEIIIPYPWEASEEVNRAMNERYQYYYIK
jgi:hypothetical protein